MRIMTNNIWGDYFGNEVQIREDQLFAIYKTYSPDVIGFQEVTQNWYKSTLMKNISKEYMLIGTEIYDHRNFVPLVVKKEYALIADGFEYLEDTPDKSKAITWAVMEGAEGRVAVCNTHFWWMSGRESEETKRKMEYSVGKAAYWTEEENNQHRNQNAKQLAGVMIQLHGRYSCPVFAFGDMNTTMGSGVFKVYHQNGIMSLFNMADTKDTVSSHHGDPVRGDDGRFHGKTTDKDYRFSIDHIVGLGDGIHVKQYRIIEDTDALDATDHSPVYADVELN